MHGTLIAEAHLVLGRVHIDVNALGLDIEEQDIGWMAAMVKHVGKGLSHGVRYRTIPDCTTVDEKILHVRLGAREGRRRHPTAELNAL